MPSRNIVTILIATLVCAVCYWSVSHNRYARVISEAMEVVETNSLVQAPRRDLFRSAMQGMLNELDDNSVFLADDHYLQMNEDLEQEFAGIGLRVLVDDETGLLTVVRPMPDTPAQEAGLRMGDVILEIDGEPTLGKTVSAVVTEIRGPVGEPVRLLIQREGVKPFNVDIRRESIEIPSVYGDTRNADGSWNFVLESHPRIGYVRLDKFGKRSTSEIEAVLNEIGPQIDGLILDLRGNTGGLLDGAVAISDLFLPADQLIVSTRGRGSRVMERFWSTAEMALNPAIPMVVLIDRMSASASEIVAASLQDHRRAVVIGERSFGKGTVQNLIPIEHGRSFLKLTVATYWRPSDRNIDRTLTGLEYDSGQGEWGVQPDRGFECQMSEEDLQQISLARRIRDDAWPFGEWDDPVADGSDTVSVPDWETVDKPLRRAVEYLKKITESRTAA